MRLGLFKAHSLLFNQLVEWYDNPLSPVKKSCCWSFVTCIAYPDVAEVHENTAESHTAARSDMRIAYFDTFSGISGDMTVGALLALGVSLDALRAELAKLPLSGYQLSQSERVQSGIRATKFEVAVSEP